MDENLLLEYIGNEEEFKKYRIDLSEEIKEKKVNVAENITYKGKIINNLYEGRGILDNKIRNIKFDGYFKDGKLEGFGRLYEEGNLIYEGFFKKNLFNGKGTKYKNNKKIYEGYFIEDKYDGIGIEYNSKGNIKRKTFYSKGIICKESLGILYDENNKQNYYGELHNGKHKKGKGLILYGENDYIIYKGDFLSFKYKGNGILYYEYDDQIKFNGLFKDDYYVKGTLYFKNGFKKYEGEFNQNIYEGDGILYFEKDNKIFYEGSFISNKFKYGTLYGLKQEILFKGEFKNNIPKEGKNIKLYKLNGYLEYEGDISNFSYNGKGKIYEDENILKFEGILENGNKVKGIAFENFIKKYDGEFKNDKYNGHGKIFELYNEKENYLYYKGNFKDNEIYGKGIKYYINGSKKNRRKFY